MVIVEAAEKFLGAIYKEKEAGSFGDYDCISFNENNVFETGWGNLIAINGQKWQRREGVSRIDFVEIFQ